MYFLFVYVAAPCAELSIPNSNYATVAVTGNTGDSPTNIICNEGYTAVDDITSTTCGTDGSFTPMTCSREFDGIFVAHLLLYLVPTVRESQTCFVLYYTNSAFCVGV